MKSVLLTSLLLFSFLILKSQQDPRIATGTQPVDKLERIALPEVDNKMLYEAELERRGPGIRPQFAQPFSVDFTPQNSGTWETDNQGNAVWRLRLYSKDAFSLNLGFTQYNMPEDGSLILYSPDQSTIMGPFTPADNEVHEQLWTPLINEEEIIVEVVLPASQKSGLGLKIESVNHAFYNFMNSSSGSCNLDVVCGIGDGFPEVEPYRDQIRSVGRMLVSGIFFCTGFLVNNEKNDCTPYFLTANHCMDDTDAPSLVVYWNYENSTCRAPGSTASGGPGDGDDGVTNIGSIYRANYAPSDFMLVELDDPVNPAANPYYMGWDATDSSPSPSVCIHHPSGDEKRISFENDASVITGYEPGGWPNDASHIRINDWDTGTTEGGSSGAPLMDTNGRAMGMLHGGYAACGNNDEDWYGRVYTSWLGGGTPNSSLKPWLDPDNTGTLVMDGRDVTVCGLFVEAQQANLEICAPQTAVFQLEASDQFAGPINLSYDVLPPGATGIFTVNPVNPGDTSSLIIVTTGVSSGIYNMILTANDGTNNTTSQLSLNVFSGAPSAVMLTQPMDGATNISFPTLMWGDLGAGITYEVEVALDNGFSNIIASANSLTAPEYADFSINPVTTYYWRVKANNICGASGWSPVYSFSTSNNICINTGVATDLPLPISSQGQQIVNSNIFINDYGTLIDINVLDIIGTHTWISDLTFKLTSPNGTEVVLVNEACDDEDDFNVSFDDDGNTTLPCPYNDGGIYQPVSPLSAFAGEEIHGWWTLTVEDGANQDGGSLDNWQLELCFVPGVDLGLLLNPGSGTFCMGEAVDFQLTAGAGFAGPVNINLNVPGTVNYTVSPNPVDPGATATITMETDNLTAGNQMVEIQAADGTNSNTVFYNLTLNEGTIAPNLSTPSNGTINVGLNAALDWDMAANANSYLAEVALDADFANIFYTETTNNTILPIPGLEANTEYYWRITSNNDCGNETSVVYSFTTETNISALTIKESDLKLYPNPSSEFFTLEFPGSVFGIVDCKIFSVDGKLQDEIVLNNPNIEQINIKNLVSGVYILKLNHSNFTLTKRLVKK